VLQKAGFQKGKYRSKFYQRAYMLEKGDENFSDLQEFFLMRPTPATLSKETVVTSKDIVPVDE